MEDSDSFDEDLQPGPPYWNLMFMVVPQFGVAQDPVMPVNHLASPHDADLQNLANFCEALPRSV